jgi:hypothetical protein
MEQTAIMRIFRVFRDISMVSRAEHHIPDSHQPFDILAEQLHSGLGWPGLRADNWLKWCSCINGWSDETNKHSEPSDIGIYVRFDLKSVLRCLDQLTQVSFDTVDFPNFASKGTWYTQAATGYIPAARTNLCLIAASAPNNPATAYTCVAT